VSNLLYGVILVIIIFILVTHKGSGRAEEFDLLNAAFVGSIVSLEVLPTGMDFGKGWEFTAEMPDGRTVTVVTGPLSDYGMLEVKKTVKTYPEKTHVAAWEKALSLGAFRAMHGAVPKISSKTNSIRWDWKGDAVVIYIIPGKKGGYSVVETVK